MKPKKVLIIDDDPLILDLITLYLKQENYQIIHATKGQEGLDLFFKHQPDLVILDLMLPDLDGLEVCQRIRQASIIPIIMLSARNEERDKVVGLGLGADDYLTKPFSSKELLARIQALFRRIEGFNKEKKEKREIIVSGNTKIDLKTYQVYINNQEIVLTAKEFELLAFLAENPNQVFTRNQLFEKVWSEDYIGESNTINVFINRLRQKLEPHSHIEIQTVRGIGYKLTLKEVRGS